MPYRRRYGRRVYRRRPAAVARRRVAYKARRYARRGRISRRPFGGYGRIKFATLKYCEEISINAGIAAVATYVFRANSLFDPNFTGVGHQPMGFDEWMARYARYAVISSTLTMRYVTETTSNATPCYFCIAQTATGSVYSGVTPTLLLENKDHSAVKQGGLIYHYNTNNNNKVSSRWSARKWYRRSAVSDYDLQADSGSNPNEVCFFECCAASVAGNDPATHSFLVTIYFKCAFFDPLTLAQS